MTRSPNQACFSGLWTDPDEEWLGYVGAAVFPVRSVAPAMDHVGLAGLLTVLGAFGAGKLRRRPTEA